MPAKLGGALASPDEPGRLWIGGAANSEDGRLYAASLARDAQCHLIGWGDAPSDDLGEAAWNDGGIVLGPNDVMFLARWPLHELGQRRAGSVQTDLVIDMSPFIDPQRDPDFDYPTVSVAGLEFVPPTFAGAGELKAVVYDNSTWHTLAIAPRKDGLFDVVGGALVTAIEGGPEGIVHVSASNHGVDGESILVAEFGADVVSIYAADDHGDPVPGSRRVFIDGLEGAEGGFIDPLSGDFVFSTFGGGNRVIAVGGFIPNPVG